MNRRRVLLALIPVNAAVAVFADDGWSRVSGIFIALGCLFAYLNARSTDRKGRPAMGLFSSKPKPGDTPLTDHAARGGCSSCDMRGPKRDTLNKANADVLGHNKRMHGGKSEGGYIEGVDR